MFEDGAILNELFLERLNYLIYVVLLLIGLHAMIAKNNLIKKLIGMSVFQTAIILFYVSIGVKEDATIPIYLPEHDPHGEHAHMVGTPEALSAEQITAYANPLPHVLMLTAIVVGVATLGLALALCQRIYQGYGTIEEDELLAKLEREDGRTRKAELPSPDTPEGDSKKKPAGKRVPKSGKKKG
jgi:multicomponent Na+:H+ antiporter subunit C